MKGRGTSLEEDLESGFEMVKADTEYDRALKGTLEGFRYELYSARHPELIQEYQNNVIAYVEAGADPNICFEDNSNDGDYLNISYRGQTVLHFLMIGNHDGHNNNAIKELVENYGANVDMRDSKGRTPLECLLQEECQREAGYNIDISTPMLLIELGADPQVKNTKGQTLTDILHDAKKNNNISEKDYIENYRKIVIAEAKKHPENLNRESPKSGLTPWEEFAISPLFNFKTGLELIKLGANPTIQLQEGMTFLHALVKHNKEGEWDKQIEELVKKFPYVIDIKDDEGLTPLQWIMNDKAFNEKMALKLVELGANPDVRNREGKHLCDLVSDDVFKNQIKEIIVAKEERSNFVYFLMTIANDISSKKVSESRFKQVPLEIILNIISYLDFDKMGKTMAEGVGLASEFLSNRDNIKNLAGREGGFHIYQSKDPNSSLSNPSYKFTFFRSVETFFLDDYKKFLSKLLEYQTHKNPRWDALRSWVKQEDPSKGLTTTSKEKLKKFIDANAAEILKEHLAILKIKDPQVLLGPIKNRVYMDKDLTDEHKSIVYKSIEKLISENKLVNPSDDLSEKPKIK